MKSFINDCRYFIEKKNHPDIGNSFFPSLGSNDNPLSSASSISPPSSSPTSPYPSRRLTWVSIAVPVGAVSIAVAATTGRAAVHRVGRLLRRPIADSQGVPDFRRGLQNEQLGGIVLGENNDDDDTRDES